MGGPTLNLPVGWHGSHGSHATVAHGPTFGVVASALGLLWTSKDQKHLSLRLPGMYWASLDGDELKGARGHHFRTWSWVGWIGHVAWLYDVLPDFPLDSRLVIRSRVMVSPRRFEPSHFVSFERLYREEPWKHSSINNVVLRLSSFRIDHHDLGMDRIGGWRLEYWSVNIESPMEDWQECMEVRCEQDARDGIDQGKLACTLICEQRRQESLRLFCLVICPNLVVQRDNLGRWKDWQPGWHRRGVVVLEKRVPAGEKVESVQMPFDDSKENLEEFDLL